MLGHPRRVLAVAAAIIAILAVVGLHAEAELASSSLAIPGSESARSEAMLKHYFGDSSAFAVLLRGPAAQIDRQGPRLVRALRRELAAVTLSPWDREAAAGLRPGPRRALILANFPVATGEAVVHTDAQLEHLVAASTSAPVRATVTGYPTFLKGIKAAAESAGKKGEKIAVAILLVVLLLVFRSPVAALVPVIFGIATVIATRGVLAVIGRWVSIDPFALPVGSMMGLALGVDYALLMVSRFREELAAGPTPLAAAQRTRRTAGRTILVAGSTLFCSLSVAMLVVPGPLFHSLIGVVLIVTALSVLMAWSVGPAVLALLGERIDRWRFGSRAEGSGRWLAKVGIALRRPGAVALAIAVPMVLLALPALGLRVGAPGPEQLPEDNPVRRAADAVDRAAGPGWGAPFVIVADADRGSIVAPRSFGPIADWERRIAADPGVETVIGPTRVVKPVSPLRQAGNRLLAGAGTDRFSRLDGGLGHAAAGVSRLRQGLAGAATGAGLLGEGSERARAGALDLGHALRRARAGGKKAVGAIDKLTGASKRLAAGQRTARIGALELKLGLGELLPTVAKEGLGRLKPLEADLAKRAAADPELRSDAATAKLLVLQLTKARTEVQHLRTTAVRLHEGLGKLADGGTQLERGTTRLSTAASKLSDGLSRLGGGSDRLADGLARLGEGAGSLQRNLASGSDRAYPLQQGLRRARTEIVSQGRTVTRQVARLRRSSPGIFDSGFFVLSALDGSGAKKSKAAGQVVDLQRGGQAARMLVIPRYALDSSGSVDLYHRLQAESVRVGREADARIGITGGTPQLADYGRVTVARFPLMIAALALTTFLLLIVFLRAVPLAAIAVLLNLATVAVAFGVLALVGRIPAGYPLGGFGTLDVTGAMSVFSVAFGLSIDYAVFLLMRMRESYEQTGDHARAVAVGLEKTARVITGAAAIMGAVFVTYAAAPLAIMSQIGVGLAVAVLLDATIVRIVLLPALMLLIGKRVWWLPGPLGRILPRLGPH